MAFRFRPAYLTQPVFSFQPTHGQRLHPRGRRLLERHGRRHQVSQLEAIFASVPGPGTDSITATNPGSSLSNALGLNVQNVAAGPIQLSPANLQAGSPASTLLVSSGVEFTTASVIQWNGSLLPTSFVSGSYLQTVVPASDLGSAGTASVTVYTPHPSYGTGISTPATLACRQQCSRWVLQSCSSDRC